MTKNGVDLEVARRRAAARFGGAMVMGAGACVLAVGLVFIKWPAPGFDVWVTITLIGVGVIAFGGALFALEARFWRFRHAFIPLVSAAIALGQWFVTDGLGFTPVFFLWVGLWIYMFMPRSEAIIHTIIMLVGVAAVFAVPDRFPTAFAYWLFVASTIAVTAVVVRRLVSTAEAATNKEREAKQALAALNSTLEARVDEQVEEMGRLTRLQRFLSPQVADSVLSADERALAPHRAEIAVVFCDLRGFSSFSASAEPEDVTALLSEFHGALDGLVKEYEATVGAFAGDGVMLYFNDPIPCDDPAGRAVSLSLDLADPMRMIASKWSARGFTIGYGVGIALGYATLGVIGFSARSDYTALGRVVNLASRLSDEAADGEILVDQRTHAALADNYEFDGHRDLDLKGFSQMVLASRVLRRRS